MGFNSISALDVVSLISASINIGLLVSNTRTMRRYHKLMGELHTQQFDLRQRQACFAQQIKAFESGKMPDTREYLEEVTG